MTLKSQIQHYSGSKHSAIKYTLFLCVSALALILGKIVAKEVIYFYFFGPHVAVLPEVNALGALIR